MSAQKAQEIKRAIGSLSQEELEELRVWLDEYAGPRPIDNRISSDLAAGSLDSVIAESIEDDEQGRSRPL